jgi:hypothetical protein
MRFELLYTDKANEALDRLEAEDEKKFAKVRKTLGLMETNLKNPGLHTHKYDAISGADGEDVWEAYVENNTPSAHRVFWHYGPGRANITIVDVTPHP